MQHARGSEDSLENGAGFTQGPRPQNPKRTRHLRHHQLHRHCHETRSICIIITILTDMSRQQREADCERCAEVWAFGDDANDVRMLSEVGRRLIGVWRAQGFAFWASEV